MLHRERDKPETCGLPSSDPRRGKEISVPLIASQLTKAPRLETLFIQAEDLFKRKDEINRETEEKIDQLQLPTRNIPVLD
jgi:hypothetical protein